MNKIISMCAEAYKSLWQESKARFWAVVLPSIASLIAITISAVQLLK